MALVLNGSGSITGVTDLATAGVTLDDAALTDPVVTGGIYLGGTGAANYLDDYEIGGYTATLTPETSGTIPLRSGVDYLSYIKIGKLVHVQGRLQTSNPLGSPVGSYMTVSLPFTTASLSESAEDGTFTWTWRDLSMGVFSSPLMGRFVGSQTVAELHGIDLATQLGTDDGIYISFNYYSA